MYYRYILARGGGVGGHADEQIFAKRVLKRKHEGKSTAPSSMRDPLRVYINMYRKHNSKNDQIQPIRAKKQTFYEKNKKKLN